MRVLYVGEFDPCGVALRQYKWLPKASSVAVDIAVRDVFWPECREVDWWLRSPASTAIDRETLTAGLMGCDLLVYCPSIAYEWSTDPEAGVVPFAEDWDTTTDALPWVEPRRKLALFHGSGNLSAHAERYAEQYRDAGWYIAATTLDYAHRMSCAFMPSIVDVGSRRAPLREDGERLRIVHCPTDTKLCSSEAFAVGANRLGIKPLIAHGQEHQLVLDGKACCHAGYDHVRGAFSINSLENAALGLANLVAVKPAYREWLAKHFDSEPLWPAIEDMDDVMRELERMRDSESSTRKWQELGRKWFDTCWNPALTASRVASIYQDAAS